MTEDEVRLYDTVRVGRGARLWTVRALWRQGDGPLLATLYPINGYSGSTVAVDRLTLVSRGETDA